MEGGGGHKVTYLDEEPLATDNFLERENWFSFRTSLSSSVENPTLILEYLGIIGSLQEQQAPMSHNEPSAQSLPLLFYLHQATSRRPKCISLCCWSEHVNKGAHSSHITTVPMKCEENENLPFVWIAQREMMHSIRWDTVPVWTEELVSALSLLQIHRCFWSLHRSRAGSEPYDSGSPLLSHPIKYSNMCVNTTAISYKVICISFFLD